MTVTREQAADCYTLAMTAYRRDVHPEEVRAWHTVFEVAGIDGGEAVRATARLCSRPGQFPPTPGDIVAEARGGGAPDLDAAIGYYLAGAWDVHPAVAVAARQVYWDRVNAPDKALHQFRQFYAAAVDAQVVRPPTGEPAHISEAMRNPLVAREAIALDAGDDGGR